MFVVCLHKLYLFKAFWFPSTKVDMWGITMLLLFIHSCVPGSATPWMTACQASLSFSISWSLLKLMTIESMVPCFGDLIELQTRSLHLLVSWCYPSSQVLLWIWLVSCLGIEPRKDQPLSHFSFLNIYEGQHRIYQMKWYIVAK